MTICKALALISTAMQCMLVLTGGSLWLRQMLCSQMFMFMDKTMHLSLLLVPIIAKSYQASLTSSFTQNINFSIYISFYALIFSYIGAALLYIYIQCPIQDFFKYFWTKAGSSHAKDG